MDYIVVIDVIVVFMFDIVIIIGVDYVKCIDM